MNQIVSQKALASPRIEQERQRRRRRDDLGSGRLLNLDVPGEKDRNYTYRWINDDPGRVRKLTVLDDWDVVTSEQLGDTSAKDSQVGSGVERIVDKSTGKRAILVRKLKDYYEADKRKESERMDAIDAVMKSGQATSPEGLSGPAAYVPSGGISIRDGRKG